MCSLTKLEEGKGATGWLRNAMVSAVVPRLLSQREEPN